MVPFTKSQLLLIMELSKSQYFDGEEKDGRIVLNGREFEKEKLYELYMWCQDILEHYTLSD